MQRWRDPLVWLTAFGLFSVAVHGATEEDISAAVQRLGSATHAERQAAAVFLVELGEEAVPVLQRAARSKDPEVRLRAVEVIAEIEERARAVPAVPEELRKRLLQKDAPDRQQVIKDLLGQGPESYRTVYGLLMSGQGEEERKAVVSSLSDAGVRAQDLVLGGEWGIKLLGAFLRSQLTTSLRCQNYAALSLITGTVSNDIAELAGRPVEQLKDEEATLLVWLHFANGDPQKAHALFQTRKVRVVPAELDIEAGASDLFDLRIEALLTSPSPHRLAATAVHSRTLDRPETYTAIVKALEALAGLAATTEHDITTMDEAVVDALLVTDRPQPALECLVKRRSYALAFEFCRASGRYADALALVEEARGKQPTLPADLAASEERLRLFHGVPDLKAELDALGDVGEGTNAVPAIRSIVWIYLSQGQSDPAKTFCRKMSVELDASAHDIAVGLSSEASLMWSWFERKHPAESDRRRLERLIDHLAVPREAKAFLALAEEMMKAADTDPDEAASRRQCWQVGFLCSGLFPVADPLDILPFESTMGSKADPLVCLGALLAANGDWESAAEWFKRAMDDQRYHAAARYLYGKALVKLGRKDEGEGFMLQGSLLPLASHHARCQLLRTLVMYGYHEDAVAQWDIAHRTGCFETSWRPVGYRFAQRLLRKEKTPAVRERLLRYMGIHEGTKAYGDVSDRLQDAAEHRCRIAEEALAAGRPEEAVALYDKAGSLSIVNVDLYADGVRLLQAADRAADAERIYRDTVDVLRENSRLFPDCAHCRNVLAWFMARCHRDLDTARQQAETAVRLQPRAAAYVDTLAEIMFHLGNREKAVELQEKAVRYAPNMPDLRERLEAFRKDPVPTGPR